MITETRKQIIELISDYMDKTLSEGCLLYSGVVNFEGEIVEYCDGIIFDDIIGHYDITALEKSIMNLGFVIITYSNHKEISNYGFNDGFGTFQNKPLHLYDTNEDENLLKLLQSLNKYI